MSRVLPRDVRAALRILEADPGRKLSTRQLAAACGVAPRTLQKHFRRFLDGSPHAVQAALRMERARRELLAAPPGACVTAIALRCGFAHLGRFAGAYARRYGETPSTTLRARRSVVDTGRISYRSRNSERPSVGVAPFICAGVVGSDAAILGEGIAAALGRKSWLTVVEPARARYRLRGTLQADGTGHHRAVLMLTDAASGHHLWADRWDGAGDAFAFQDRVAEGVASAVERVVRNTEIDEARRRPIADLDAWHLTMRALPDALLIDPAAQARALELLERAMELAPEDALPPALAAWCHGQRAGHGFTAAPAAEKQAARALAERAAPRGGHDPIVQALVGAAYTLAHELGAAAHHLARALALDPACVWAWNRSGWVSLYEGKSADAIERFHIARTIAPDDELSFYCTIGIAAAHFEAGRYTEAARWYARGLVEHPSATWVNRFLAPSQALAGMKDQARYSVAELSRGFPGLTIAEVTSALPNTPGFLARQAEGLEAAGLRP